jgi:hypothetical protein
VLRPKGITMQQCDAAVAWARGFRLFSQHES